MISEQVLYSNVFHPAQSNKQRFCGLLNFVTEQFYGFINNPFASNVSFFGNEDDMYIVCKLADSGITIRASTEDGVEATIMSDDPGRNYGGISTELKYTIKYPLYNMTGATHNDLIGNYLWQCINLHITQNNVIQSFDQILYINLYDDILKLYEKNIPFCLHNRQFCILFETVEDKIAYQLEHE